MTTDTVDNGHGVPKDNFHATLESWREKFEEAQTHPPEKDFVLTTQPNEVSTKFKVSGKVKIKIDLQPGKAPLMYALAVIPAVVGDTVGWFCRDANDPSNYGFKCILLPNARDALIRKCGMPKDLTLRVKSLRVVKLSRSAKCILAEVQEYA